MKHLPPWLQDVPLPERPASRSHEEEDTGDEAFQEPFQEPSQEPSSGGMPSWLADVTESSPPNSYENESSDWFEESDPFSSTPEAIPDWLRDLQGEIGEPQAAQSSSTQPSTLRIRQPIGATDWLRSLGVDEEQPRSEEPAQEESPSVAEEDEDLPDEVERHITGMLPDVSTDELEQEIERVETLQLENLPSDQYPDDEDYPEASNEPYTPTSPPASDEPQPFNIDDILAGEAPPDDSGSWVGSGPTIPMNIEEDMPAWMQDESSDFPSAETDESSSAMEMPDWLSSLGGGGEDEEEMTAGSQASSPPPPIDAESDEGSVPDWLFSGNEPEDTTGDSGMPDWFADIGGGGEDDTQPAAVAGAAEDDSGIPDWMSAIGGGDDDTQSSVIADNEPAAADDSGVPDWLSGIGGGDEDDTQSAAVAETADDSGVPDWLSGIGGGDEDDQQPAAVAETADDSGVPDWLSGIGGGDEDDQQPAAVAETSDDSGVPNWLSGFDSDGDDGDDIESSLGSDDEGVLPDWLASDTGDTGTTAAEDEQDTASWFSGIGDEDETKPSSEGDFPSWFSKEDDAAAEEEGSFPSWLGGGDEGGGDESVAKAPSEAPSEAEDDSGLPNWLSGDEATEVAPSAAFQDQTSETPPWLGEDESGAADDGGLPPWLQKTEGEEDDFVATASPDDTTTTDSLDVSDSDADTQTDFGSWFDDTDIETPTLPGEEDQEMKGSENTGFLGGSDIPAWLRPSEPSKPKETEDTRKAKSWLEKIRQFEDEEEEESAAEVAPPTISLPRPIYQRSASQMQAANLLEQLIANPYPESPPPEPAPEPTTWQKIGIERVLSIALAGILLIGLIFPAFTAMFRPNEPVASLGGTKTEALFNTVDSLSEGDIVLIAYEWDGQNKSELRPLEEAVTQHLMAQKTHLILMSTDPQGTMLSFDLRDPLQQAGYVGKGVDYVLLGYRPGGELALRSIAKDFRSTLSSDFKGQDATIGGVATDLETREPRITSIHDVSMIVVMGDHLQDVQMWIEQVHREAPEIPMAFVLPSEVAPLAQPYFQYDMVYSLVGKQGALSYKTLLGSAFGNQAIATSTAQTSGHYYFTIAAFLGLVVVGIFVRVVGSKIPPRSRPPKHPAEKPEKAGKKPRQKQEKKKDAKEPPPKKADKKADKRAEKKPDQKQKRDAQSKKKKGT